MFSRNAPEAIDTMIEQIQSTPSRACSRTCGSSRRSERSCCLRSGIGLATCCNTCSTNEWAEGVGLEPTDRYIAVFRRPRACEKA